jgi:hypothetical protein
MTTSLAPFYALSPDIILNALESIGLTGDGRMLALNSYLISKMLQPSEAKPLGEAQRRWRQRSGAWEACRAGTDG